MSVGVRDKAKNNNNKVRRPVSVVTDHFFKGLISKTKEVV